MKRVIFSVITGLISTCVLAQESEVEQPRNGWSIGGSAANLWISPEAAEREGLGETSFGLKLFGEYKHGMWLGSFGLNAYTLDDRDEFSQTTENQTTGDIENSSSSAEALGFFAAVGPIWELGKEQKFSLYSQLGFSNIFSAERSISFCDNCRKENIELDAGLYITAGGFYEIHRNGKLGLSIEQYIASDDLERELSISYRYSL